MAEFVGDGEDFAGLRVGFVDINGFFFAAEGAGDVGAIEGDVESFEIELFE